MLFSSIEFIFGFLPAFLLAYYIVPANFRNTILFVGSLCFYGMGERIYVFLILISLIINHKFALLYRFLTRQWEKNLFLISGLLFDFGILCFFKYSNFFIENWNGLLVFLNERYQTMLGFSLPLLPSVSVVMPLGISFYTFQIVSYLCDVYKEKIKAEKRIVRLGTYICMFPQLIAGPIVIYPEVVKELKERTYHMQNIEEGFKFFVLGLGSKVLIANTFGTLWNQVQVIGFESISPPMAWIGMFAFTLQIYFDFNGYSLMAVGLGRILGFHLPRNFNQPYLAKSVTEFWHRWHITLGRWFREYVYIPLGGSKKGRIFTIINLFIVWSLTGLWHGASWNFVLWGLTFFLLLTIEKLILKRYLDKLVIFPRIYMLLVIPMSWMVFAIEDLQQLKVFFTRLFPADIMELIIFWQHNDVQKEFPRYALFFMLAILLCLPYPRRLYERFKKGWFVLCGLLGIFWICIYQLFQQVNNPFLYFRF